KRTRQNQVAHQPHWLGQVGLNSQTDLAGFIGLAGPYDFLPIQSRTLRTIFGGANRAETQPASPGVFARGKPRVKFEALVISLGDDEDYDVCDADKVIGLVAR